MWEVLAAIVIISDGFERRSGQAALLYAYVDTPAAAILVNSSLASKHVSSNADTRRAIGGSSIE